MFFIFKRLIVWVKFFLRWSFIWKIMFNTRTFLRWPMWSKMFMIRWMRWRIIINNSWLFSLNRNFVTLKYAILTHTSWCYALIWILHLTLVLRFIWALPLVKVIHSAFINAWQKWLVLIAKVLVPWGSMNSNIRILCVFSKGLIRSIRISWNLDVLISTPYQIILKWNNWLFSSVLITSEWGFTWSTWPRIPNSYTTIIIETSGLLSPIQGFRDWAIFIWYLWTFLWIAHLISLNLHISSLRLNT